MALFCASPSTSARSTGSFEAVKDRYNAKTYDEIKIRVPKGQKDLIQAHAEAQGESTNGFINRAISETMERDGKPKTD